MPESPIASPWPNGTAPRLERRRRDGGHRRQDDRLGLVLSGTVLATLLILLLIGSEVRGRQADAGSGAAGAFVGSNSCVLCHRGIHQEMSDLPHRGLMDATRHRGCEECHGPAGAHLESLGAPATITLTQRPGAEPLSNNAACIQCHQFDATEAGCFDRLERGLGPLCASCHAVHPGTGRLAPDEIARLTADAATERRLRSPLRGPTLGKADDLPPLEEAVTPAPAFTYVGEVTGGWRFVSNEDPQYDQDINLDPGPRLLDVHATGRWHAPDRLFDQIELVATGVDDPYTLLSAEIERFDDWDVLTRYQKFDSVYVAGGDPHQFFVKREIADARFEVALSDVTTLTIGFAWSHRKGDGPYSRYVLPIQNDVFEIAPADVEHDTYTGDLALELPLGSVFRALFRQSASVDTNDDRRSFEETIPDPPFLETEDFRSKSRGLTPVTVLKVWGDPVPDTLHLEGSLLVSRSDITGDVDADSSGLDENLDPFLATTDGEYTISRDREGFALAASYEVAEPVTLSARYDLRIENEDGEYDETLTIISSGQVIATTDTTKLRERTHRIQGDVEVEAVEGVLLRGGYEYFIEDLEVSIDEQDPETDGTGGGPYLGADLRPTSNLVIKGLLRTAHDSDPTTEISPEDDDSASLAVRWAPADALSLKGYGRYALRRNRYALAVGDRNGKSRSETIAAGGSASWTPLEPVTLTGSYDYLDQDLSADTVFYFNFDPTFRESTFDGHSHTGTVFLTWRLTESVRLNGDFIGVLTRGDYPYEYLDLRARAEYDVLADLTLGAEVRRVTFDEDDRNDNDTTSWITLITATWRF